MKDKSSNLIMLHSNEMGYVARCKCCSEVQMALGNVVCTVDKENFQAFFSMLNRLSRKREDYLAELPDGEKILIQTPLTNMYLSFSPEEFDQTLDLCSKASIMLEANELIKGNQSQS